MFSNINNLHPYSKDEIAEYIKTKNWVFIIDKDTINELSRELSQRNLSDEEMAYVCCIILNNLCDWDDWIKEIIAEVKCHS
jgi:hypothetical protein